ncbi:excalibur calcium-binding domain-containing protein [Sinomonas atrocyanea]|nr:excalibur calcium-binding domain-containing protein [Sinomonas atrocyanea]
MERVSSPSRPRTGAAPLYAGRPGYRIDLDRDHDGVACER